MINNTSSDDKDIEKESAIANLSKIINAIEDDYNKVQSGELSLDEFWTKNHPRIIEIESEKDFKKILEPKKYKDITAYVSSFSTLLSELNLAEKQEDKKEVTVKTIQAKTKIDDLIKSLKEYENKPGQEIIKKSKYTTEKRKKIAIISAIISAIIVSVAIIIYFAILGPIISNQDPIAMIDYPSSIDLKNIMEGERITLNGNRSTDPEGKPLKYQWTQINSTASTIVNIKNLDRDSITFALPSNLSKDETFTFKLGVYENDNQAKSGYDTISLTVKANRAPIAIAGENIIKKEGEVVTLYGARSTDPEGKPLKYQWTQINGTKLDIVKNVVMQETIAELNQESIEFKLPNNLAKDENFIFELVVSDDKNRKSKSSLVQVTAENVNRIPEYQVKDFDVLVNKVTSNLGNLTYPVDLVIDENMLMVVDHSENNIHSFEKTSINEFGFKPLETSFKIGNSDFPNNLIISDPRGIAGKSASYFGPYFISDNIGNRIIKMTLDPFRSEIQLSKIIGKEFTFVEPSGIAINSYDSTFVVDTGNNRIQKFDSNGDFIKMWGSEGKEPGNFFSPQGLAIDSNDNVYVVDTGNNRIQKFDSNGNNITMWGSSGYEQGIFYYPQGIAIDTNDNVYVVDTGSDRILKFDGNGKYIGEWANNATFGSLSSDGMTVKIDQKGILYIGSEIEDIILRINSSSKSVMDDIPFFEHYMTKPCIVDKENKNAYCILGKNDTSNSLYHFKVGEEPHIQQPQIFGNGTDDPLNNLSGIAISPDNYVYISQLSKDRIIKYDGDLNFVSEQNKASNNTDLLHEPEFITIDSNNNVYLYENGTNRIIKYDGDLNFIDQFDLSNYGFDSIASMITYSHFLYVVSTSNDKILILDTISKDHKIIGETGIARGYFNKPTSIDVDKNGNIFVADSGNNRIQKGTPTFQ